MAIKIKLGEICVQCLFALKMSLILNKPYLIKLTSNRVLLMNAYKTIVNKIF